jgi:acyl-CoA synthetase (NDP forming)
MKAAAQIFAEARALKRPALDEPAAKQLLTGLGINVPRSRVVKDALEAVAACAALNSPVVLKVISLDILHKSDAGGVAVGLKTAADVEQAVRAMMALPQIAEARIDGFLVEEMAPAGQELVVGGLRDPQFGPLVMTGLGGVFVEALADVSFRICPITRLDAQEMLAELKGATLLDGARGRKPASRDAVLEVLLKVGGAGGLLTTHAADIQELDINPLIVYEHGAVAVDARIVLTQPPMNADRRR